MVDSMQLDVPDHADVRWCTIYDYRARYHHSAILWNLSWRDNRGCYTGDRQGRRPVLAKCLHVGVEFSHYADLIWRLMLSKKNFQTIRCSQVSQWGSV